ncbi:cytochrome p450 oxidoreductase [Fusarium heterosporum]|uniref:Choline monooxygenase, chloroplastic n=1 Tax=Fusarium heterosporum TaxID=42747 RepID=A0A8H5TUJ2_FUSHE|nr:cytochrome p450 oxidoreductase [Fusarium heterosporum]
MNRWFNFGVAKDEDQSPKTTRALPASWYRSSAMYELERRAIFSKKWIVVSHKARFVQSGDFLRITEAGFNFFLIKDRQGEIRAHHNVCRHRAYPLVEEDSGKLSILSCKYHGWSYGLDGKLAKAPKYQEVPSFDKTANDLFTIHVHVDKLGFVWINMESNSTPSVTWSDDFASVDTQPRLERFNMENYHFDHQWEMTGDYNWKTLADNYNECYHCPTGHPAVNALTDLSKYWVETEGGHIQHFNVDKSDGTGLGIYSTFYYPNASITISPDFFYIMRCIPISASQTKMEYEVYRHNDASDHDFNNISDCFKQILKEDKDLCNAAQKNLNAGIFVNGELHPRVEKGPLFFQELTRSLVMEHHKQEEGVGQQIWPAAPKAATSGEAQEDVDFCNKLECSGSDGLEW